MKEEYLTQKLKTAKHYEFNYHDELLELSVKQSPLWELMRQVTTAQTSAIESYLKLRIRKRPFYLPNFLWKFLLSKVVHLQYLK